MKTDKAIAATFINMTYRQVIMKRGIPFSIDLPAEIKTIDTIAQMEEIRDYIANGLIHKAHVITCPFFSYT